MVLYHGSYQAALCEAFHYLLVCLYVGENLEHKRNLDFINHTTISVFLSDPLDMKLTSGWYLYVPVQSLMFFHLSYLGLRNDNSRSFEIVIVSGVQISVGL